jgi:hypothetical protein
MKSADPARRGLRHRSLPRGARSALLLAALATGCGGGGGASLPQAVRFAPNCTVLPVTSGQNVYTIYVTGELAPSGGSLTNASGTWSRGVVSLSTVPPPGTVVVTASVSTAPPMPMPTNSPLFFYSGTYTVNSKFGQTIGCMQMSASQGPVGTGVNANLWNAQGAGWAFGPPGVGTNISAAASGAITALTLSVSPSGTGVGSFTLDDGSSGTIAITAI